MSITIWHALVVFVVMVFAVPVGIAVFFLVRHLRRTPSGSAADRIVELDDLLRRGLISTDEHQRQRADIIATV